MKLMTKKYTLEDNQWAGGVTTQILWILSKCWPEGQSLHCKSLRSKYFGK